jgi:hypothetical protein
MGIQKLKSGARAGLFPHFVAFCGDFPGARTALSAKCLQSERNTRTKLSALPGLRPGGAETGRNKSMQKQKFMALK